MTTGLQLWLFLGAMLVVAGVYLLVTGGDQLTAGGVLIVGLVYPLMFAWIDWRRRRR